MAVGDPHARIAIDSEGATAMQPKAILVPVNGVDDATATLAAAVLLGRKFGARVEAVHAALDPQRSVPFLGEGMTGAMVEEVMAAIAREEGVRAGRARAQIDAACTAAGVALSAGADAPGFAVVYSEEQAREEDMVAARGRLADLIVLARPADADDVEPSLSLHAAITDTGRPVLMLPPVAAPTIGSTVAVAWNGSAPCARALSEALPLLAEARRVVLFNADDELLGPDAEAARRYLAWHGVAAEVHSLKAGSASAGEALLQAAGDIGADLLVMGAYTRSRIRRLIYGGVTRDVLELAELPVLLVH